jgi:dienelactone hydrolase/predicted outer membrane lipoprotein
VKHGYRFWVLTILIASAFGCVSASFGGQRAVDLTAADGTKLKATYFDAGKPGPGVLLLHQCNRDRKVWDGLAIQLSGAGLNVMTIDNRGFGESGGTPHDKNPDEAATEKEKWPGDFDTAVKYLESQPGVARETIGVGGASCGVNNSLQLARVRPEVRSLVLLAGPTDLNGRNYLRNTAKTPVLFSVADDDEFPPSVQDIEWLYSITSNPGKKFLHYATGKHGAEMFPTHPELMDAIVDWYVTTLIKTPGQAPMVKDPPAIPPEVRNLDLIDDSVGVAKLGTMVEAARQSGSKAEPFPEAIVNFTGYEHMQAGDTKLAIEIFKLNVAAFPESPNTYDSLSDAYIATKQNDLAIENVKKALALLPADTKDNKAFRDQLTETDEKKLNDLGGSAQ